jgi:alpha-1,3/alpha-1,6-mannosyltransferase
VNSQFTAGIFRQTFQRLSHCKPDVLYPSLHSASFDRVRRWPPSRQAVLWQLKMPQLAHDAHGSTRQAVDESRFAALAKTSARRVFLSINRYERKKNLRLALEVSPAASSASAQR